MRTVVQDLEERGVYVGRNLLRGHRYLYAVTAAGEVLPKVLTLRPGVDDSRAWQRMWALLDGLDPLPPCLELVKSAAPSPGPKQLTVDEIDRIYIDADPIATMLQQRKRERLKGQLRPLRRFS